MIPVVRPRSTRTTRPSRRCTVPCIISPSCSLNSLNTTSRSASRNFCVITCFAVIAAMRPNSPASGSGVRSTSPTWEPNFNTRASEIMISVFGLKCGPSSSSKTNAAGSSLRSGPRLRPSANCAASASVFTRRSSSNFANNSGSTSSTTVFTSNAFAPPVSGSNSTSIFWFLSPKSFR